MLAPTRNDLKLAAADFIAGIKVWPLWTAIAWQEIRQRYRRSTFGPFWLTLGMGINILAIGLVWGALFKFNRAEFIPYLTIGTLVWTLITDSIREANSTFISYAALIKQMRRPYSMYIFVATYRNIIIFGHNVIIFFIVVLYYRVTPSLSALSLPVAFFLVLMSFSWTGPLFGTLSTRFRDVPQVISYILVVAFFVTPIMWKPGQLGRGAIIADLNPFYHMIELIRAPLLGQTAPLLSWIVVLGITILGWTVAFIFFARFRSRIAYWL